MRVVPSHLRYYKRKASRKKAGFREYFSGPSLFLWLAFLGPILVCIIRMREMLVIPLWVRHGLWRALEVFVSGEKLLFFSSFFAVFCCFCAFLQMWGCQLWGIASMESQFILYALNCGSGEYSGGYVGNLREGLRESVMGWAGAGREGPAALAGRRGGWLANSRGGGCSRKSWVYSPGGTGNLIHTAELSRLFPGSSRGGVPSPAANFLERRGACF